MAIIGEREHVLGLRFGAYLSAEELALVLAEAVRAAGMTPCGPPVTKKFPSPAGLGGEGDLLFQTLGAPAEVFQMLHESGILGNTYVWRDKWGRVQKCTRILLASCLEIPPTYRRFLTERLGPVQDDGFFAY
ncbi:MAG: hypothetical protein QME75_14530 [Deltaproteobacteria bacterium]|nr:hypothetical protein [Deltaproteobacteria bacterium]